MTTDKSLFCLFARSLFPSKPHRHDRVMLDALAPPAEFASPSRPPFGEGLRPRRSGDRRSPPFPTRSPNVVLRSASVAAPRRGRVKVKVATPCDDSEGFHPLESRRETLRLPVPEWGRGSWGGLPGPGDVSAARTPNLATFVKCRVSAQYVPWTSVIIAFLQFQPPDRNLVRSLHFRVFEPDAAS